jgi:Holliday junction DNA helicase RuvA
MISYLKGILVGKSPTIIVVEVGNTGYEVEIPISTFEKLGAVGEPVKIFTSLHFREDLIQLFGFASLDEKRLFELLKGVSGIGPQLARNILSRIDVEQFVTAVTEKDVNSMITVPGIGEKTAQRILLELSDKIAKAFHGMPALQEGVPGSEIYEEANAALIRLGYSHSEVRRLITEVTRSRKDITSVEELIKEILRRAK